MSNQRRTELKFQDHLIASYGRFGGEARKWASEWQKGVPDVVATLPGVGLHLTEVKHRPEFVGQTLTNPLDKLQQHTAKEFIAGGGDVLLCVIGHMTNAVGSRAYWFNPLSELINTGNAVLIGSYVPGIGFPVNLLHEAIKQVRKQNGRG